MNFVFNTVYDMDALTAMARAVRKTSKGKYSKIRRIYIVTMIVLMILMVALTLLLNKFNFKILMLTLAGLAILIAMKFEDRINAMLASKRVMKGAEKGVVTFGEDSYVSATEVGTTEFKYSVIEAIAKRGDYIVFVFTRRHAQVYDLRAMSNGTPKEFCKFIQEKTGLEIIKI